MVVRDVYKYHEYGYNMQEIADTLNSKGYVTRSEGKFTRSQVRNILANKKTYLGEYRYGGSEWVKGEQEAII